MKQPFLALGFYYDENIPVFDIKKKFKVKGRYLSVCNGKTNCKIICDFLIDSKDCENHLMKDIKIFFYSNMMKDFLL